MYIQKLASLRTILIIPQAICQAETDSKDIYDATCGIIFLGTPHQGSDASYPGLLLALLTTPIFGSKVVLLRLLQKHSTELSTLRKMFSRTISRMKDSHTQMREKPYERLPLIYTFIETKDTLVFNFLSLGRVWNLALKWLSLLTGTRLLTGIPLPLILLKTQSQSTRIIQV